MWNLFILLGTRSSLFFSPSLRLLSLPLPPLQPAHLPPPVVGILQDRGRRSKLKSLFLETIKIIQGSLENPSFSIFFLPPHLLIWPCNLSGKFNLERESIEECGGGGHLRIVQRMVIASAKLSQALLAPITEHVDSVIGPQLEDFTPLVVSDQSPFTFLERLNFSRLELASPFLWSCAPDSEPGQRFLSWSASRRTSCRPAASSSPGKDAVSCLHNKQCGSHTAAHARP